MTDGNVREVFLVLYNNECEWADTYGNTSIPTITTIGSRDDEFSRVPKVYKVNISEWC